jgi:hypothetical protein
VRTWDQLTRRQQQVAEAIGRDIPLPDHPSPDHRAAFLTDAQIARELGIDVSSVRTHINSLDNNLDGLEQFAPRPRIFLYYRDHLLALRIAARARALLPVLALVLTLVRAPRPAHTVAHEQRFRSRLAAGVTAVWHVCAAGAGRLA